METIQEYYSRITIEKKEKLKLIKEVCLNSMNSENMEHIIEELRLFKVFSDRAHKDFEALPNKGLPNEKL